MTQVKGAYFFNEDNLGLLIHKTAFDVKPNVLVDEVPLSVDFNIIRKIIFVGPEFLKKVHLTNCFPIFRKAIFKINLDEKGESLDNEVWDCDAKLIAGKSFGSSGFLPISNDNI